MIEKLKQILKQMTKKHQVLIPSLTKSNPGKPLWIPLTTKLEKHNIVLLEEHGYPVETQVLQATYRMVSSENFKPSLLYAYMTLQDMCRGSFFNKFRYPYFVFFLKNIYKVPLTTKQTKVYDKFLSDNQLCTINDLEGNFSSYSPTDTNEKTEGVVKKKIILFSSNTVGIGKTTTSNKLVEAIEDSVKISFMDQTRDHLAGIFSEMGLDGNYWKEPLYSENKNIKQNFNSNYNEFVQRTLLCDYSDLLQKHFGKDCWAKAMSYAIEQSKEKYIFVDDLRRPIELDYLIKEHGKENILTVYLTKEDTEEVVLSDSSSAYEGQLDPNTFDIQFKFTSDWNNTDELITLINTKLVH